MQLPRDRCPLGRERVSGVLALLMLGSAYLLLHVGGPIGMTSDQHTGHPHRGGESR
jgi:hypothetical protein